MTTVFVGTDEQLVNCLRLAANTRNCPSVHGGAMIEAAARIEALIAERDAAVAQMQAALAERNKAEEWLQMAKSNTAEYERVVMAMGERRATAAIVAWLRVDNGRCDCSARSEGECACGAWSDYKQLPLEVIADRIEAGEAKP